MAQNALLFAFWSEEIAAFAFGESGSEVRSSEIEVDAVDELERRYAEGETDEGEFERRPGRLLDVEDALTHLASAELGFDAGPGSGERRAERPEGPDSRESER